MVWSIGPAIACGARKQNLIMSQTSMLPWSANVNFTKPSYLPQLLCAEMQNGNNGDIHFLYFKGLS